MSQNSHKSKTPTSTSIKSNRLSKLLKKKKKGKKSKSSKSQHHLDLNDETHCPPVIRHHTSSSIITTPTINNIERYHSSADSEHEQSTPKTQTQTLRNTRSLSHLQYNQSKSNKLNTNTNKRNKPPPPPPKKPIHHKTHSKSKHHTATYAHHDDSNRNININIDINKNHHKLTKRSNTRRSRHNSIDTDSPISPSSPQSPAARFISHIPRESIEHNINIKQLLFEMIEMKRQIKSLKKDIKYLKTENDLCHRRITFLENKSDKHSQRSRYLYNNNMTMASPPEINLHPQPLDIDTSLSIMGQMNLGPSQVQNIQTRPKRLSLSKQTPGIERSTSLTSMQSSSMEPVELNLNDNINEDMELKLRKLSHKLSNTNVFSNEYKRLQYELNKYEENLNKNNYFENESEYNNGTMIIHNEKDKYVQSHGHGHTKGLRRLSRRTTKGYKHKHVKQQSAEKYMNESNDSGECEYPSTFNSEGMEIID